MKIGFSEHLQRAPIGWPFTCREIANGYQDYGFPDHITCWLIDFVSNPLFGPSQRDNSIDLFAVAMMKKAIISVGTFNDGVALPASPSQT